MSELKAIPQFYPLPKCKTPGINPANIVLYLQVIILAQQKLTSEKV